MTTDIHPIRIAVALGWTTDQRLCGSNFSYTDHFNRFVIVDKDGLTSQEKL